MRYPVAYVAAVVVLITSVLAVPAVAQSIPTPPPQERPTADQLFQLYAGKTWLWTDGAGYFSPDRRFVAWSGSGKTASYAAGTWRTSDLGLLCFSATWRGSGYAAPDTTCFSHRIKGRAVYQHREPDGMWYIFRHDPVRKRDEYRKLVGGDRATAGFERNRLALGGAPVVRSWWWWCRTGR
jgi:hypothetical protein